MKARVTNGPATFFMAPTAVLLTYHEVYEKGLGTKLCDTYKGSTVLLFSKGGTL